jgi:hypothetical protein
MFGSAAAPYFKLPESLQTEYKSSELVKSIDADLKLIREIIIVNAQRHVAARYGDTDPLKQNMYQPGDFVLFQRWMPSELKPTKMTAPFTGPFEVLNQVKNNVTCRHLATGKVEIFYVERLRIFHGSREVARETSLRDHDQYVIDKIVSHRGDIDKRKHLQFLTLYTDNTYVWNPMNADLSETVPFENYCESIPSLRRLLMTKKQETVYLRDIRKTPIDKLEAYKVTGHERTAFEVVSIGPGTVAYVDLRTWSDASLTWFYNIGLPNPDTTPYLVEVHYLNWTNDKHLNITVNCPLYDTTTDVDSYWVFAHGSRLTMPPLSTLVDAAFAEKYPSILNQ